MPNLMVRPVADRDMWDLFAWANDPVTRANSFDQQRITPQQHHDWFRARLTDDNAWGYILAADGVAVGIAWYARQGRAAEASVMVAPEHRGHGYAAVLLRESGRLALAAMGVRRIKALVFADNEASLRSFERAGYVRRGRPCWVLDWDGATPVPNAVAVVEDERGALLRQLAKATQEVKSRPQWMQDALARERENR